MFFMRQTIIVVSRHIEYELKNEIYHQYQRLSPAFYLRHRTGDLLARISEDVSRVRMYLGPVLMYGVNLFTLFALIIPMMFYINPTLAAYTLLPLPLLSISIYFINTIINRKSERIQSQLSRLSAFVQEAFSGIRIIQSFVCEKSFLGRFVKESEEYKQRNMSLLFVESLFFPMFVGLIGMSTLLAVYVGSNEVLARRISLGNIAEFIIYINMLSWPVAALGWASSLAQRAAASQQRLNVLLKDASTVRSGKDKPNTFLPSIRFENVSFRYNDRLTGHAIHKMSFALQERKTLAVVGEIGSGKSSLAQLLCRLYDPQEGNIYIGDTPIEAYDIHYLRRRIGYVPQDSFLFSDTIAANIGYGLSDVSSERITQVAQQASLQTDISQFVQGYHTMIGERGIMLSGGQKQRIALARALIRRPDMLILDDCLSAVDTQTEHIILENLKKTLQACTVVIITHRISSVKLADHILVLSQGAIAEQGTHDTLLKQKGYYAKMHAHQLRSTEAPPS